MIDPQVQRLPDLKEMRIGRFAPDEPHDDRFSGAWDDQAAYVRVDLVFEGLMNPPGPLGLGDHTPVFDPFRFGPNPLFGFIEFDMDANVDTGGELSAPQFRYLANVARFGGIPAIPEISDRVARDGTAVDGSFSTMPWVERSGEEFHWVFLGEEISSIEVNHEQSGGDPAIFQAGERWIVEGKLLHRAHGFEDFALMCFDDEGRYDVEVKLYYVHTVSTNTTTISLVYPLTNAASAALQAPNEPVDPNDGCADDQNSVEEALVDLQFSATIADPVTRSLPEFQLIADWEFETPADHLDPAGWRLSALLGSAYGVAQPDGARFIWTDVWPNPVVGDFNGDGMQNPSDTSDLVDFITQFDGDPLYDMDGNNMNASITWTNFAVSFCVYDTNYDGVITGSDAVLVGDMDLNLTVDVNDTDDFVMGLVDSDAYRASHAGEDPAVRGDTNGDGAFDGADIAAFVGLLVSD